MPFLPPNQQRQSTEGSKRIFTEIHRCATWWWINLWQTGISNRNYVIQTRASVQTTLTEKWEESQLWRTWNQGHLISRLLWLASFFHGIQSLIIDSILCISSAYRQLWLFRRMHLCAAVTAVCSYCSQGTDADSHLPLLLPPHHY